MPFDHVTVNVPAAAFSPLITFLTTSLSPLALKEIFRPFPTVVGLGETEPYFWLSSIEVEGAEKQGIENSLKGLHIAFTAKNAEQVRAFHAAGTKAGGTCNGEPGLRPHYHPGYYGAFVLDPVCGINIEAVCHTGE